MPDGMNKLASLECLHPQMSLLSAVFRHTQKKFVQSCRGTVTKAVAPQNASVFVKHMCGCLAGKY